MKMIASKTVTKIFLYLIAFVSLAFVSCSLMDTEEETGGFAVLRICCDGALDAARTVMPETPQSLNDMSHFVLKGNRKNETETQLKEWNSYSQVVNDSLTILPGIWTFTLTTDYNGVRYTGKVENKEIKKDTSTTINFTLEPPATGTGSISVTIKWPDSSQVQKVTATLCNSSGSAVGAETNLAISGNSATYTNSAAAAGNYFVKFNFYRDAAGTDKINTYACAVQVMAEFDSSGTETITLLNNKYTLTLDANGGTFAAGVDTTRTFTEYEYVDLPNYSDVSYDGYAFKGWYENAAGTGAKVESWNVSGMKRDLTLYAKWEVVTEIYLDGASGSDSNTGEDASHAVATLEKALEKLNLAASNPRIIVVTPYTLASGESLEIAAGNEVTLVRGSGCAGSLITVPASGTLSLSGAVQILGDVYLSSGATVTVAGTLAPPDATTPVAVITPAAYTETPTVLSAATATLLADNIDKFALPSTATNYAIAQDDINTTNAVIVDNTPRETVYLDASGGSDVNDGSEKAKAVKTLTRATSILDYTAATPKIIVVSPYTLASTETTLLDFSTKVTLPKVVTIERWYSSNTSGNYCSGNLITISSGTVEIKNVTLDGNWKASGGTGSEQLANAGGSLLYVDSGATVTLGAGCTFKNNSKSGAGGGIFNNGTLNFSEAAAVDSNNDVYLNSSKYITITSDLTGTAPVAKITPDSYTSGRVILQAANADLITNNYSKFALSDTSTYEIYPDSATPTQAILTNFITIATAADFTTELNSNPNANIKLAADIDISGNSTLCTTTPFNGIIDGNGHTITISDANRFADANSGDFAVCIFGKIGSDGVIKNLTVSSSDIAVGSGASFGGICKDNDGTIENCTNNINFSSSASTREVGGICINNNGTIKNCTNSGNLALTTGTVYSNCPNVGGIAATNKGTIENCTNNGTLVCNKNLGPIVGRMDSGTVTGCTDNKGITVKGSGR